MDVLGQGTQNTPPLRSTSSAWARDGTRRREPTAGLLVPRLWRGSPERRARARIASEVCSWRHAPRVVALLPQHQGDEHERAAPEVMQVGEPALGVKFYAAHPRAEVPKRRAREPAPGETLRPIVVPIL